jgi:hypothetical protein
MESISRPIEVHNRCENDVEMYEINGVRCPQVSEVVFFGFHARKPPERSLRSETNPEKEKYPFYFLNTTKTFPDVKPVNNAELGLRGAGVIIPILIIVLVFSMFYHCYRRVHRTYRNRSPTLPVTGTLESPHLYTVAQVSPRDPA